MKTQKEIQLKALNEAIHKLSTILPYEELEMTVKHEVWANLKGIRYFIIKARNKELNERGTV